MKEDEINKLKYNSRETAYIGGYNIVKAYTSLESIRIFHGQNRGFEIQAHDDFEILLVLSGNMQLETENAKYSLFAMDVAVINSNKYHIIQGDEFSEVIVLQIKKEFVMSYYEKDKVSVENFYSCNTNFKLRKAIIKLLLVNYEQPENHHILKVFISEILEELNLKEIDSNDEKSSPNEKQKIVYSIIEELSHDIHISLETFSDRFHISYSHLSREFYNVAGVHFTDYVRHIKLNMAVHRLINSELSLTEVAIESGFSNSQVFSRIFREEFSQTPSNFRKMHTNGHPRVVPDNLVKKIETELKQLEENITSDKAYSKEYFLNLDGMSYYKLKKSWGKVIDFNQLIHGNFYISEFINNLEKFNPDYLRLDFVLREGVYWPVFDTQYDGRLTKNSFDELMQTINQLGISLLLRIKVNREEDNYEESLINHSQAINRLLDYASLKVGLVNLQHWSFELYLENSNISEDIDWIYELSKMMVKEVQKKLLIENLDWGIYLGIYNDYKNFESIVKALNQTFENHQPSFLSLEYNLDNDHLNLKNTTQLSERHHLSNFLEELPFRYLIDLSFKFDYPYTKFNPMKEALYCICIIRAMLGLKVEFQLTSLKLIDVSGTQIDSFFDDMGMETVTYYFAYLVSNLFTNIRYEEPGLIVSTDFDDNYNIILFSVPSYNSDHFTTMDFTNEKKIKKIINLLDIKGKYKIVESRIPLMRFNQYYSWLSSLNPDALSNQEKQNIRNKITPELKVSVEYIESSYSKSIDLNTLDLVLIEFKKV